MELRPNAGVLAFLNQTFAIGFSRVEFVRVEFMRVEFVRVEFVRVERFR
jgi:hypothetical protein